MENAKNIQEEYSFLSMNILMGKKWNVKIYNNWKINDN